MSTDGTDDGHDLLSLQRKFEAADLCFERFLGTRKLFVFQDTSAIFLPNRETFRMPALPLQRPFGAGFAPDLPEFLSILRALVAMGTADRLGNAR